MMLDEIEFEKIGHLIDREWIHFEIYFEDSIMSNCDEVEASTFKQRNSQAHRFEIFFHLPQSIDIPEYDDNNNSSII